MNAYLIAIVILILIDLFWIGTAGIVARSMVERIQGSPFRVRYIPAFLTYVLLAYLVLQTRSYREAFLMGVAVYGVYECTNLAMFEQWDWKFAVADTLWGGVLMVCARYLLKRSQLA